MTRILQIWMADTKNAQKHTIWSPETSLKQTHIAVLCHLTTMLGCPWSSLTGAKRCLTPGVKYWLAVPFAFAKPTGLQLPQTCILHTMTLSIHLEWTQPSYPLIKLSHDNCLLLFPLLCDCVCCHWTNLVKCELEKHKRSLTNAWKKKFSRTSSTI